AGVGEDVGHDVHAHVVEHLVGLRSRRVVGRLDDDAGLHEVGVADVDHLAQGGGDEHVARELEEDVVGDVLAVRELGHRPAGMCTSRFTPITWLMARVKRRVRASSSRWLMPVGSTPTPPLAPPKGRSRSAVFQVMSDASARTSSRSTDGWYRTPPLYGPLAPLCWA